MKCRNCDGFKVFKNARCPDCAGLGASKCAACKGEPWPENRCLVKDCRYGRTSCEPCRGTGKVKSDCPVCEKGRVRPNGAVGGTDLTVKCRNCEKADGTHGDGTLEDDCKLCERSGRVTCKECGGAFARTGGPTATVQPSLIFKVEPCAPCAACAKIGGKIVPASDPSKTLR